MMKIFMSLIIIFAPIFLHGIIIYPIDGVGNASIDSFFETEVAIVCEPYLQEENLRFDRSEIRSRYAISSQSR